MSEIKNRLRRLTQNQMRCDEPGPDIFAFDKGKKLSQKQHIQLNLKCSQDKAPRSGRTQEQTAAVFYPDLGHKFSQILEQLGSHSPPQTTDQTRIRLIEQQAREFHQQVCQMEIDRPTIQNPENLLSNRRNTICSNSQFPFKLKAELQQTTPQENKITNKLHRYEKASESETRAKPKNQTVKFNKLIPLLKLKQKESGDQVENGGWRLNTETVSIKEDPRLNKQFHSPQHKAENKKLLTEVPKRMNVARTIYFKNAESVTARGAKHQQAPLLKFQQINDQLLYDSDTQITTTSLKRNDPSKSPKTSLLSGMGKAKSLGQNQGNQLVERVQTLIQTPRKGSQLIETFYGLGAQKKVNGDNQVKNTEKLLQKFKLLSAMGKRTQGVGRYSLEILGKVSSIISFEQ